MWHIIVKIVSPFTYNCLTLKSLISDFYLIISPTPEVPFPDLLPSVPAQSILMEAEKHIALP